MTSPLWKVPLVDLQASFAADREEIFSRWNEVLDGMQLMLGPEAEAFEREFGAYLGVEHGLGVSSGTDALSAALSACGIGPGDEVAVPSLTFFASVETIAKTGATPLFVDVDSETLTIDPVALRAAVGPATRAVIPVHLYGNPAEMAAINEIARSHGLRVIEDAAQAHGAQDRGQRCGSIGDVGCFSFYFTKNLGALGEGGFVSTDDPEIAERVRLLRNHGRVSKSVHASYGANLRLDELQAAVLRIRLRRLDAMGQRRREIAARYDACFDGSGVRTLRVRGDARAVYHVYPIRVRDRDALIAHLTENGVQTGVHYDPPVHLQPALRDQPQRCGPLPITEAASRELVSLPIYPELSDEQLEYVAKQVLAWIEQPGRRSESGTPSG